MIDPKDVTIIIPHLGASEESQFALTQCLPSLLETSECPIIIATNGSEKHTFSGDLERVTQVHVSAQGQCKAVNAAVATTNTPWIFVTNDDMVYAPGWFESLTRIVDLSGNVTDKPLLAFDGERPVCLSPMLVEPRPGAPTFQEYFCGGAGGDFDKTKFLKYVEDWKGKRFMQGGHRPGFNLPFLIRRDLWDTVGGYDINYDPWGSNSDSDLEYKIKLAGVLPRQNKNCLVYHFSQTSGTFHPDNQAHWQKNWDYFIEKWGFPRTDEGIWEATFDIPEPPVRKFTPDWEGKYAVRV